MKKIAALSLASLLLISLMACAGSSAKQGVRVKCPACGYEFEPASK